MILSMITYNIRKGLGAHHAEPAFHSLSSTLRDMNPDVVMCQEVAECYTDTSFSQSLTLAQSLNHHHHYAANAFHNRGNHGNATFSKFPILTSQNHNISTNPIEKRGLQHTTITIDNQTVHLINTHFGLTPWQRRTQCKRLIQLIRSKVPADAPLLIAGDFNDFSGYIRKTLTKQGIVHCALSEAPKHSKKTWPSFMPLFQLDGIFYRNLKVLQSSVLQNKTWQRLSDHLPIRTEFQLPAISQ